MNRQLWFVPVIFLLGLSLFLAACDDPNSADLPPQPYTLRAIHNTGTPIVDLSVSGEVVALATGYIGYDVLDASNLSALTLVDSMRINSPGQEVQDIAVDARNRLVAATNTDPFDPNRIWDYGRDSWVASFNATGAADINFYSRPDTADLWYSLSGTDIRIIAQRLVRRDTSWTITGSTVWDLPTWSAARMQGFSIRADGILALAYLAGVHLHNSVTFEGITEFMTPGRSYDCDWYGDYIIVAAEYFMVIVDASDLQNPVVAHRMEIRGADRLRQVAVDGHYAALMDNADGVYIVDVSNVASPRLVQTISLPEPAGVEAGNRRIYIADQQRGLLIYTR